jgi:RNA polymerase primary sigma factor
MLTEHISAPARVPAYPVRDPVLTVEELAPPFRGLTKSVPHALENFSRTHRGPENLWHYDSPASFKTEQEVYRQSHRGESVHALAERLNRTRARFDRFVSTLRASRIMELPLESMGNECFASLRAQNMEAEILGPPPASDLPKTKPQAPSGLPAYLASLYEVPLLTREQQVHLFRKMNYLKYSAIRLRGQLDCRCPKSQLMDQIEKLYDESVATRNQIIRANLRLVVSIAKRYVTPAKDLFELISDGNMCLLRAVEKFDFSRGTSFPSYASVALFRNFTTSITTELRRRHRFLTSQAEVLSDTESCADPFVEGSSQSWRETFMNRVLRCLDKRELQIIAGRFGLVRSQGQLTLEQLGAELGVSIERIRQIQCRAMDKLRKASEDDRTDWNRSLGRYARNPPRRDESGQLRTAGTRSEESRLRWMS